MPIYVYETIPAAGEAAERFEVKQHFDEPPLTSHPDTGLPVRRVISGGFGYMATAEAGAEPRGGACGPETCQCGRFN